LGQRRPSRRREYHENNPTHERIMV
jgi:hypothetical protein